MLTFSDNYLNLYVLTLEKLMCYFRYTHTYTNLLVMYFFFIKIKFTRGWETIQYLIAVGFDKIWLFKLVQSYAYFYSLISHGCSSFDPIQGRI